MHSRLLPLAPPQRLFIIPRLRDTLPGLTLLSMPWLELGFFAVMIVGLVRLST